MLCQPRDTGFTALPSVAIGCLESEETPGAAHIFRAVLQLAVGEDLCGTPSRAVANVQAGLECATRAEDP